jgi:phage host-nuclease inhibitor protein Gam
MAKTKTKAKAKKEEVVLDKIVNDTKLEKINEQQLAKLQSTIRTVEQLTNEVGGIEVRKHALLKAMESVQNRMEAFRQELIKEYGTDNINIQTGEITYPSENPNPQTNGEADKKN